MSEGTQGYVPILVGDYRLALPAGAVASVITDVITGEPGLFRGQRLPVVDLAAVFGGRRRLVAPFAVVVQSRGESFLVGVDRVEHRELRGEVVRVPRVGLLRADLFEGAVRDASGLWLILSPRCLVGL